MEISLLLSLKKEERAKVKGVSTNKTSTLFKQGDECNEIGIVVSGEVQICLNAINGKKIIFNVLKTGGVFGNNLIFSSNNKYKGDVVVKNKSVIAIIKKDDLVTFLQTNKNFLFEYLKVQSDFCKSLNTRNQILINDNSEDRVIAYFSMHNNVVEINSITDLADELNVTREAMSRCLKRMIQKGILKRNVKTYKLVEKK